VSEVADISEAMAEGFDALRETLIGDSASLVLLREDGVSGPFETIATITAGWHSEFSEFFGNTVFNVADLTAEFAAKVRKTDHLIVTGTDIPDLNNMIHETLENTAPPDAGNPWWRIVAKPVGRKYVASAEI
jgi:hypothetical protein